MLEVSEARVCLTAPLRPNTNHHQTAFGGSVAALAILSGWALLHARLASRRAAVSLVIQRQQLEYLLPVAAAFEAICPAPPAAEWERALLDALRLAPDERAAFVNEQLTEMDYMTRRWQRVPRVCASVASSSGFLLASLALRNALADPSAFAEETRSAALGSALTAAVNVAAIGMAGAAFCIAAQMRATKAARARLDATDKLVERLESLTS